VVAEAGQVGQVVRDVLLVVHAGRQEHDEGQGLGGFAVTVRIPVDVIHIGCAVRVGCVRVGINGGDDVADVGLGESNELVQRRRLGQGLALNQCVGDVAVDGQSRVEQGIVHGGHAFNLVILRQVGNERHQTGAVVLLVDRDRVVIQL